MRVVIFTGLHDFERTPWWQVLATQPTVERVLICQQVQTLTFRQTLRRFRRNIARHGLLFIPYRAGLLVVQLLRRPFAKRLPSGSPSSIPLEYSIASDLHCPDVLARVAAFDADLGISIGAPILRPSLFRLPRRGTINLHLGKVPDYRGAPPGFWELVHNAPSIGATVHWMDEGLDTGAVISECEAPIYTEDSWIDVTDRATELGVHAFGSALDALIHGDPQGRRQPSAGNTNRFPTLGQRIMLGRRMTARRLRRRLSLRQIAKDTATTVALYLYRPVRDAMRTVRRRHPVRIFTFHRITALCRDGMTLSPKQFAEQVDYLARHHEIVSLERGIDLIRTSARLSRPVAVITFDDAYRSVFTAARPILTERQLSAACFVSTDLVGTDRRFEHDATSPVKPFLDVMSWSELTALHAGGWSVGAHTANHVRLSACHSDLLKREIAEPRRALSSQLRTDAAVLAFPFGGPGDISADALNVARDAGHTTVLADYDGENHTGNSAFVLGRFDIGGDRPPIVWKALAHGLDVSRWRHLWPV